MSVDVNKKPFGEGPAGESIVLFLIRNQNGLEIKALNYGCIIASVLAMNKRGQREDIVLGFDNFTDYLAGQGYFGCVLGRYGNRIEKGEVPLESGVYQLTRNEGHNHLHGGKRGFDKKVWNWKMIESEGVAGVEFFRTSPDGEEGYPGNLEVSVRYLVPEEEDGLVIEYEANSDKETILNLTNHSFFNLMGDGKGDILKHELEIRASRFLPVRDDKIPTGEMRRVEGTPMDFRQRRRIAERMYDEDDPQLVIGRGYDHCFVLDKENGDFGLAARVWEIDSGRLMEVWTSEPGIQFYSGNYLNGSITGKGDVAFSRHKGFCLETQHFPNSPYHRQFPSVILRPGMTFESRTVYKFRVV